MSRRRATIAAFAIVAALCLGLVGCQLQPGDPAGSDGQPNSADIEATVQAALGSLEDSQPANPTGAASPVEIPTPALGGAGPRLPAPMFTGALLDGNEYRLADTLGTPTLLMFWAPW